MLEGFGLVDKIVVIFTVVVIFLFMAVIIISRTKYEWEREELSDYWGKCRDDKLFDEDEREDKRNNNE